MTSLRHALTPSSTRWATGLLALALTVVTSAFFATREAQAAQPVDGDKLVKLRLVAEKDHFIAGETNWVGIAFNVTRDWYVYWRNPGGGMPTSWELAEDIKGVELGEAVWPTPERYETQFGGLDFIHHGFFFVMIPVEIDESVAGLEELTLKLDVSWLACKEICVPGDGEAELTLPVAKSVNDSRSARLFEQARAEMPEVVEDLSEAGIVAGFEDDALNITVSGADALAFYAYENEEGVYPDQEMAAKVTKITGEAMRIPYFAGDPALLDEIRGLLVVTKGEAETKHEITVPTASGG